MIGEFKDFIIRGNALELAIGLILGIAFGAVITSLVDDVLMQIVAAIFGKPDFSALTIPLGDAELRIGKLINAVINLLLIGLALFIVVKAVMRARRASQDEASDADPADVMLLREIRDELRQQRT